LHSLEANLICPTLVQIFCVQRKDIAAEAL